MKRSEMIKILDDAVYEHTDVGSSCCNLGINYETLSKVLQTLEDHGMLPPENKEKSFKILSNGEMIYNVNKWDEE